MFLARRSQPSSFRLWHLDTSCFNLNLQNFNSTIGRNPILPWKIPTVIRNSSHNNPKSSDAYSNLVDKIFTISLLKAHCLSEPGIHVPFLSRFWIKKYSSYLVELLKNSPSILSSFCSRSIVTLAITPAVISSLFTR